MAPRPGSCRRVPALEALWGPSEAGLWTRLMPLPGLATHSLPKPAAVAAATAAAAAAAAAAATDPGGRSSGGRSSPWVQGDFGMGDEVRLGKLLRFD